MLLINPPTICSWRITDADSLATKYQSIDKVIVSWSLMLMTMMVMHEVGKFLTWLGNVR